MSCKVLFLDVDGVLNSAAWFAQNPAATGLESLDPVAIARVKRVLKTTSAQVVLSSTWRFVPNFVKALLHMNVPMLSITPRIDSNHRGEEIHAWLQSHTAIDRFAIIDDDDDAGDGFDLAPHFVQTHWNTGMTEAHEHALIALLKD